jgi:hypothetical protein
MASRLGVGAAAAGGALFGLLGGTFVGMATAPDWDGFAGSRKDFEKSVRARMGTGALLGVLAGAFVVAAIASPEEAQAATKSTAGGALVGGSAGDGLPAPLPMPGS